jgi:hypothetical protein
MDLSFSRSRRTSLRALMGLPVPNGLFLGSIHGLHPLRLSRLSASAWSHMATSSGAGMYDQPASAA